MSMLFRRGLAYAFGLKQLTVKLIGNLQKVKAPKKQLMFGAALIGSLMIAAINPIKLIEDDQIIGLRSLMNREINKLKSEYGQMTVYPQIKYQMRGNTYTITFEIDQRKCDMLSLITQFISVYTNQKGFKVTDMKGFTQNGVSTTYIEFQETDPKWKTPIKGRLTITGIKSNERPSFRLIFQKNDQLTQKNQKGLALCYKQAVKPKVNTYDNDQQNKNQRKAINTQGTQTKGKGNDTISKLQQLGLTIFDPNNKTINLDWDYLAGYQKQKRLIQDTVLLALNYPQIYDEITEHTRVKYEPNRPKAVLFEGPPGTGKTTSAKIISQQVNIPLIYMPIEAIMSKFYGQSQQKLSEMWELCKKLGKVIIFIDEIDALASSRDSDMHQASRRILSTLLRKIDSFESTTDVLLICATNRKKDLDPAMLSRIDLSIQFSLPDKQSRAAIFARYAKHLTNEELQFLAGQTEHFSGRNISDVCKNAQRRWASKLIRKETDIKLPTLNEYLISLTERKENDLA